MLGGMSRDERNEQYAWMRTRGHTTVPLAVHNDYPRFARWHWDWWAQPDVLAARCDELTGEGFEVLLVLHPRPGASMRDHVRAVRTIWPAVAGKVGGVMWGWEINDLRGEWANGSRQLDYLRDLKAVVGETPMGVHFTPERWAGWPGFDGTDQDKTEVAWLIEARKRGVHWLLYQESLNKTPDEKLERMVRIPSPHGWSPGIAGRVVDGAGLGFVAFEFARDEAEHAAVVATLARDARVVGWC